MRTLNIIGCGDTAKLWDGLGDSLGVNDCWKFGKPTQGLLVVDSPSKFTEKRLKTIVNSKPQRFYTKLLIWKDYFENLEYLTLKRWTGRLEKNRIQNSMTTPFIALSLAYNWNYEEVILWGVDFMNHKTYSEGREEFNEERIRYRELIGAMQGYGIKVWLGADGALRDFVEIKRKEYA